MTQRLQNNITRHSFGRTVFTIGHSNVSFEKLRERLSLYDIVRVVDVRTKPYSRWCPQFNRHQLQQLLEANGIVYDWRGSNLGGLDDNVDYDSTLRWVYDLAEHGNIALMCSEADYRKCHRYTTLTPDLEALGAELVHISYE